MVLTISAFFSEEKKTYQKGLQIWQRLMNNTRFIGKEDGTEPVIGVVNDKDGITQ